MRKVVLIPAYQPDEGLVRLVRELVARGLDVLVVNDGSDERCQRVFDAVSGMAEVVGHPENQGKGEAIKTGIAAIRERFSGPYIIVTADADGQHAPADICRIADAAESSPGALVLGSRHLDSDAPARSRIGNAVTRLVFRLSTGVPVHDTQTGLRAFDDEAAAWMLGIEGARYEYEMNVLLRWSRERRPIREVPIQTVYIDGNRASHFDTVRDSARIYREIVKFSGSSFASFLVDYALFCVLFALFGAAGFAGALIMANVMARVASATLNFNLNRRFVFESSAPLVRSAIRYALLACGILICNTALLQAIALAGAVPQLAKVLVEVTMFLVSYTVQRTFVFKSGKVREAGRYGVRVRRGSDRHEIVSL